tara:strand:+ start:161 stop:601 length:441 start_codon:yes stop_codon:yes gene_type:complete
MKIVIQKVNNASVIIDKNIKSSIKRGLLCYVAFSTLDNQMDLDWISSKIFKIKLYNNHSSSVLDVGGELLIVSQFTLFASFKRGMRPSWSRAAKPIPAKLLYDTFITLCQSKMSNIIQTGIFGSNMQIQSINDGPVTILLDSKDKT